MDRNFSFAYQPICVHKGEDTVNALYSPYTSNGVTVPINRYASYINGELVNEVQRG